MSSWAAAHIAATGFRSHGMPAQSGQQGRRGAPEERNNCSGEQRALTNATRARDNAYTAYQTAQEAYQQASFGGLGPAVTAAYNQQSRAHAALQAAVAAENQALQQYQSCMNPTMSTSTMYGHMEQGGWGRRKTLRRRGRKGSKGRKGTRRN